MKKKILFASVLAAALSATAFGVCSADEVKYNYKFNMESDKEFKMMYGYSGGTDSTVHKQPGFGKEFSSGKYGNALKITYPGWKISDGSKRYNAYCLILPEDPVKVGEESKTILEVLKDTQQISFWVRTPVTVDHGNGAVANRLLDMSFALKNTEGKETRYSYRITLPNTGDWSYITIPSADFKNGSTTMLDAVQADNWVSVSQINFNFPYRDYFGADPDDSTWTAPWEEPLEIDEFLLDCSKEGVIAVTPASSGEESYVANTNLNNILVDGRIVSGFDKTALSNTIPVPAYCTPEELAEHISAEVEAPALTATSWRQPVSGATYTLNPPSQIPGEGSITIISGDRKSRKTYNLSFTKRAPFQINVQDIDGLAPDGSLPGGSAAIKIPVMNEGGTDVLSSAAVLVLKDNDTKEAKSAAYVPVKEIAPEATEQYSFTLDIPENSYAEVYFFDSLDTMNLKTEPIKLPYSDIAYKKASAGVFDSSISYDENGRILKITGTVTGTATGEHVIAAVTDSMGNPADVTLMEISGRNFSGEIKLKDSLNGKVNVYIYANGSRTEKQFYKASPSEMSECLSDFASASGDCLGFFNKYSAVLNIPEELILMLGDTEKAEAVKAAAGSYTDFAQLKQAVNEGVVLEVLNKNRTLEAAQTIYNNYNNYAGFDNTTDYFTKYITEQTSVDNILKRLVKTEHSSIRQLRDDFKTLSLAEAINSVSTYSQVGVLINGNTEQLTPYFNYSGFNRLSSAQKTGFYQAVVRAGDIEKPDDLNPILTAYINGLNTGVGGGGTGGGGGSSSGGKGTSGGMGVASVQTPPSVSAGEPPTVTVTHRATFTDMKEGHWAYNSVSALEALGILSGRDDGSYGTNDAVTREEFVKMLLGVFKISVSDDHENTFSDVPADAWYAPYVITANQKGIVNGVSDTEFGVGKSITRQDMSVMISRMLEASGMVVETSIETKFDDDADVSEYARKSVYGLKNVNLINGKGDNMFMPKDNATRAEAAMLLYSVYGYINQ